MVISTLWIAPFVGVLGSAAFTEAHRQLEEWTKRVIQISGLQERLPLYQRTSRIIHRCLGWEGDEGWIVGPWE